MLLQLTPDSLSFDRGEGVVEIDTPYCIAGCQKFLRGDFCPELLVESIMDEPDDWGDDEPEYDICNIKKELEMDVEYDDWLPYYDEPFV